MRGLCVSKLFPPSKKGTVSKITAPKQKQNKDLKKRWGKVKKFVLHISIFGVTRLQDT